VMLTVSVLSRLMRRVNSCLILVSSSINVESYGPETRKISEDGISNLSQVDFAQSSLCDRIAFAPAPRRNRTAFLPSREKHCRTAWLRFAVHFLWSGFRL